MDDRHEGLPLDTSDRRHTFPLMSLITAECAFRGRRTQEVVS